MAINVLQLVSDTVERVSRGLGPKPKPDDILEEERKRAARMEPTQGGPAYVHNTYIDPLVAGSHRENVSNAYKDSLKLINNVQEFKTHLDARENHLNSVTVDGEPLKFKSELNPKMQTLLTNFNNLNQFLAKSEANNNLEGLLGTLHQFKSEAINAIKEQQEADFNAFDAELGKKVFANPEPAKVESLKEEARRTFKKSQSDALESFEKSMNAKLNLSHLEAQKERDRVVLLHTLYNDSNNRQMRRVIDALYEKNMQAKRDRGEDSDIAAEINLMDGFKSAKFANIKVEDIPVITTLTGRKIKQMGTDGSNYIMDLPNHWLGALYYASSRQKMVSDLTVMAMALRASGHDTVSVTIDDNNPKNALAAARAAYEACRLAGFKDEDIKITFNAPVTDEHGRRSSRQQVYKVQTSKGDDGVERTENPFQEKLFSDSISYQTIQKRAEIYDKGLTESTISTQKTTEFQKTLAEFRTKANSAAPVGQPPVVTSPTAQGPGP